MAVAIDELHHPFVPAYFMNARIVVATFLTVTRVHPFVPHVVRYVSISVMLIESKGCFFSPYQHIN